MPQLVAAAIIAAAAVLSRLPSAAGFAPPRREPPIHPLHTSQHAQTAPDDSGMQKWGSPPYLAVLTEPDACSSLERVEETLRAIDGATRDDNVDLVVVRVADDSANDASVHKWALLRNLAALKSDRGFALVVNDDADIVLRALSEGVDVDGVHVKERNAHLIPSIRSQLEHAATCAFDAESKREVIVGTSCHSIDSAISSYQLAPRGPDYLFVGTCYLTQSHPEKGSVDQLEGPGLPGRVKQKLNLLQRDRDTLPWPPIIFAIGGIDEHNCREPVELGADGVATIRTVMQAGDPGEAAKRMKTTLQR
ncbi:hypothetical protein ACHAXT_003521 [Thalassiosira profunda]